MVKTAEQSTWLYHELGRCQLELGNFNEARDLGEKALAAANESQDQMWQLNASVLVAQAESKLCNIIIWFSNTFIPVLNLRGNHSASTPHSNLQLGLEIPYGINFKRGCIINVPRVGSTAPRAYRVYKPLTAPINV